MIDEKRFAAFKAAWAEIPPQVRASVLVGIVRDCDGMIKSHHRHGLRHGEVGMERRMLISHTIRDAYALLADLGVMLVNDADAEAAEANPDAYVPFEKKDEE